MLVVREQVEAVVIIGGSKEWFQFSAGVHVKAQDYSDLLLVATSSGDASIWSDWQRWPLRRDTIV